MRYSITIPGVPPSTNEHDRWYAYKKREQKRRWESDVIALCNEKGNVAPRGLVKVRLRSVIFFTTNRNRDSADNYRHPFYKWTLDGLRYAGVLVNDTSENVKADDPVLSVGQSESTFVLVEWEEESHAALHEF